MFARWWRFATIGNESPCYFFAFTTTVHVIPADSR